MSTPTISLCKVTKQTAIQESLDGYYFWRTHTGQEIDIIKETNGALTAIECKWSGKPARIPALWKKTYPEATFITINRENYLEHLLR